MNKFIIILILTALLSSSSFSQTNWNLDYQCANFGLLIVDFNSNNFEGGYFTKFPYQAGYDTMNIPLNVIYNPPVDSGDISFIYSATNDTVFSGVIWWMGQGHITLPVEIDSASIFTYDPTVVKDPVSVSYFSYENVLSDSIFHEKADSVWMSLKRLSVLKKFAEQSSNYKLGIYLYTPVLGIGDYTRHKWIIFLYTGQLIDGIENSMSHPDHYRLFQNYPNPFNPSTTIAYSISKSSFVKLKLFDALGREIMTMVDEFKTSGNYSVKLNAENLSSGIYFYKIQAGDISETKKMILMK